MVLTITAKARFERRMFDLKPARQHRAGGSFDLFETVQ